MSADTCTCRHAVSPVFTCPVHNVETVPGYEETDTLRMEADRVRVSVVAEHYRETPTCDLPNLCGPAVLRRLEKCVDYRTMSQTWAVGQGLPKVAPETVARMKRQLTRSRPIRARKPKFPNMYVYGDYPHRVRLTRAELDEMNTFAHDVYVARKGSTTKKTWDRMVRRQGSQDYIELKLRPIAVQQWLADHGKLPAMHDFCDRLDAAMEGML